jgi:hypothetical protein
LISDTARNAAMVLYALPKLFYYEHLIRKHAIDDIVKKISKKNHRQNRSCPTGNARGRNLLILWKACHFIQHRLLRKEKPCLPRSLVLFDWCLRKGQRATLVIGLKKTENHLEGHSWLVIDGKPFQENLAFLDTFHVVFSTDTETVYRVSGI